MENQPSPSLNLWRPACGWMSFATNLLVERGGRGQRIGRREIAAGGAALYGDLPHGASNLSEKLSTSAAGRRALLAQSGLLVVAQEGRFQPVLETAPTCSLMTDLIGYLTDECCGGSSRLAPARHAGARRSIPDCIDCGLIQRPPFLCRTDHPLTHANVLFLCTHNSARSILSEAC